VYEVPLLFVPPTINKYYILDISPGRSMIQWLLEQQQQVFTISWRNPGAAQGHFDLDTYARAVLEARDAVAEITGQESVNMNAARKELAAAAVADSARRGYIDGRTLAGVFAWLRPNDLVWNYVVNNYLLGKDPPAFDILYWNQDTVRLAAGLHRDFIRTALGNAFTKPATVDVLGTPIDLGAITLDSYEIAGLNDHIVPWENAYRSAQLLGGTKRLVLSTSGHIQALVNPPSPETRASYRVTDDPTEDPTDWVANADVKQGSWWPDYRDWLTERAGTLKPAPKTLGSRTHRATAKAPGSYVHAD
jgi:poly[(R)-3-hydroxyalkanoate] polymerase subunit PhaC